MVCHATAFFSKVKLEGKLDLYGMGVVKGVPPVFQDHSFESIIDIPASVEELRPIEDAVEGVYPILDTLVRSVPVNAKVGYIAAIAT